MKQKGHNHVNGEVSVKNARLVFMKTQEATEG